MKLTRRRFGSGAMVLGAASLVGARVSAAEGASSIQRIKHWVVVMMENRSFDSLLGYLPHISAEDGILDRPVSLKYPGGSVDLHQATQFWDPNPDPGEAWPNVNVQLWNQYLPASNGGKAAYPSFPNFMDAPYNLPADPGVPAMDGFALDYYWNFKWWVGREPAAQEMLPIAAMYTPTTAPVINTLAAEYAVFTRWFCEVPTCTMPNRAFFFTGTSQGRIDNELEYNYLLSETAKSLFDLFEEKKVDWKVYYDRKTQIVPECVINLGGLRHPVEWDLHLATLEDFLADAAAGKLPSFAWLEPNMMYAPLSDYHPPEDIRAAELFLASAYTAVRNSPAWEETALIICFDEHGGCYDHVPPPAIEPPDDSVGALGFRFDRLGLRVPAIVVSPYTAQGTVIRDTFHNCSVLRTMRDQFDLGPPLTRRDAIAPNLAPAFNLTDPRTDQPKLTVQNYDPSTGGNARLSQIAEFTLRNSARMVGVDPGTVPKDPAGAQTFMEKMFFENGRFRLPTRL
jgi:phospholipase C